MGTIILVGVIPLRRPFEPTNTGSMPHLPAVETFFGGGILPFWGERCFPLLIPKVC